MMSDAAQQGQSLSYTAAVYSRGRLDLLRATVQSFLEHADMRPDQFFVVEDSGSYGARTALAGLEAELNAPFEVIVNSKPIGRTASFRMVKQRAQTSMMYCCGDDWGFMRAGFIAASAQVLRRHPEFSFVGALAVADLEGSGNPPMRSPGGPGFFEISPLSPKFLGPGMLLAKNYEPVAKYIDTGGKGDLRAANLSEPAVYRLQAFTTKPSAEPFELGGRLPRPQRLSGRRPDAMEAVLNLFRKENK